MKNAIIAAAIIISGGGITYSLGEIASAINISYGDGVFVGTGMIAGGFFMLLCCIFYSLMYGKNKQGDVYFTSDI